jgi:hypothetical protein
MPDVFTDWPYYGHGMKFISAVQYQNVREGFEVAVNSNIATWLYVFKNEVSSYYDTFFSRKGAAPICLALCSVVVLVYITSNAGSLI